MTNQPQEAFRQRVEIVDAVLTGIDRRDELLAIVGTAQDADEARDRLKAAFDLNEVQATALLDLQIRRLTRLSHRRIQDERDGLRDPEWGTVTYPEPVTAPAAPSGAQYEIVHADHRATIVEVGGGVRSYDVAGRAVLHPYDEDAMCDGAHGTPLIPWPNRLADGKYRFEGEEYQVELTEPDKHNAIHGFLVWRSWQAVDRQADRVTMAITLHPMMGYPFTLDLRVEYVLGDDGLTVTTTATNTGVGVAPYGCGSHPYLSPGAGVVDDCVLRLDAATRIVTDPDRQLPTGTEHVDGTDFDFRQGRLIGSTEIDFAFGDLTRDGDGRAWVELTAPDGWTAATWVDESFPIVELYTADTLAPERRRKGLGTEPMTLPPNGFATGENLISLEPGQTHTSRWGVQLRPPV